MVEGEGVRVRRQDGGVIAVLDTSCCRMAANDSVRKERSACGPAELVRGMDSHAYASGAHVLLTGLTVGCAHDVPINCTRRAMRVASATDAASAHAWWLWMDLRH